MWFRWEHVNYLHRAILCIDAIFCLPRDIFLKFLNFSVDLNFAHSSFSETSFSVIPMQII